MYPAGHTHYLPIHSVYSFFSSVNSPSLQNSVFPMTILGLHEELMAHTSFYDALLIVSDFCLCFSLVLFT